MCAGMPLWMPSFKASGRAPSSTTWTVTSWSLRKTSRSVMRNSARAGAAKASANAAATRWLGNHRARIRRTGNYSVANARHAWQMRDGGLSETGLDRGETGCRDEALAPSGLAGGRVGGGRRGHRHRSPPLEPNRALDREHQLEIQGVTAVARDDVRTEGPAEQRQIAQKVQDLVADELVAVAQAVQGAAVAEHDRVVKRTAAGQAVLAHQPEVPEEAVRPCRRELLDARPLGGRPREALRPDRRMVVVQAVADPERVRRHDMDPPPGAAHSERTRKRQHASPRRLLQAARGREHRHEGLRAPVQRGNLGAVHVDLDVVDAKPGRRRHQVLDGLNARALHTEGRRVVGVDNALGPGRDPLARRAQVEHHARVHGCGGNGDAGDLARMQADSLDAHWLSNGVLAHRPIRKLATGVPWDTRTATIGLLRALVGFRRAGVVQMTRVCRAHVSDARHQMSTMTRTS